MGKIIYFLTATAIVLGLVVASQTPAHAATIYENTDAFYAYITSANTGEQYGDEITLAGTERLVTEFTFAYYNMVSNPDGDETARIRFYENNGAGGEPGTVLYDSTAFNIAVTSAGSWAAYTLDLTGLGVVVPDTFIWTMEFGGTTQALNFAGDSDYLSPLFAQFGSPPTGSSGDFYWYYDNSTWDNTWSFGGDPLANLYARVDAAAAAVPEPSTLLLLGSGLAGLAFVRRRFRG